MDIVKELKKQVNDIMRDDEKKEKAGDAVEGVLKQVKKSVKGDKEKALIDKVIKEVDKATTSKKSKKK